MKEANSTEETCVDEIDLSSHFAVLWKRKKLIIYGTLGALLLSIVISLLLPNLYRSEGFFQLGNPSKMTAEIKISLLGNLTKKITENEKKTASIGVPVPLYKSISTRFSNPNHFQFIASHYKSFGENELEKIKDNFKTAEDINKWIKPVYAFAKEDAREFAQLPQDETNGVIGLDLAYEADSPVKASAYVRFFGDYIRDCLLYGTLYKYIMDGYSKAASTLIKNENEIIGFKFELVQNTNKMKDIRTILSNYPESAKIESRQLVSIQDGGSRFLAPVTQLVGIESTMADLRQDLAELERDREKLIVLAEYFTLCFSELEKIGENGESLFLLLKSTKDAVFENKDLNKNEVKEVFNTITMDLQSFDLTFYKNTHFISEPTIPTVHIKPRKSLIVIVSCFATFLLLVVWSFVLRWWMCNKNVIMSSPSDSGAKN